MEKKPGANHVCPHCGTPLHEDASFCPYCAQSVNQRVTPTPPWCVPIRVLRLGVILLILAGLILGVWLYNRPRTYDGAGEVFYSDEDATYQLLLSYVDSRYSPLPERTDDAELDVDYRLPSCLFINMKDSGADANQGFMQKVERVTTAFTQSPDSPSPMNCDPPAANAAFPDAALASSITFTGRSTPAELVWTIQMKNGDTILLRQKYSVNPIQTYDYYPEDTPMNTVEALQALVDKVEQTVEKKAAINIHLPAVTYEGGLDVEERGINFYGSTEGEERTTFTDTVRVTERKSWISYFYDIDFVGDGGGVGVSSSSRAHLINCTVSGWKTGVLAYGEAWVNVTNCLVENNGVGFHYNSTGKGVSHTKYVNNRFLGNDTALLLENVPSDVTLDLSGCLFSDNGKDIDNLCNQSLDLSEATFK